jgi:hypothetical protein
MARVIALDPRVFGARGTAVRHYPAIVGGRVEAQRRTTVDRAFQLTDR